MFMLILLNQYERMNSDDFSLIQRSNNRKRTLADMIHFWMWLSFLRGTFQIFSVDDFA